MLLDEPLANLDYKLREELREELPRIFSATGAIFVYATTEPLEALLLGGSTATLARGRITQFGPTLEVYRRPNSLETAQIFSDPPMNIARGGRRRSVRSPRRRGHLTMPAVRASSPACRTAPYTLGFRPNHLLAEPPGADAIAGHRQRRASPRSPVRRASSTSTSRGVRWVALAHGVHDLADRPAGRALSRSRPLLRLRRRRRARGGAGACSGRRRGSGDGAHRSRHCRPFLRGRSRAGPQDYALKPLDHVWEDGGAYALLGPSGCGKTTLLNIISGLITPTRGPHPVRRQGRDAPADRRSATSPRCSSSRSSTTR